MGKIELIDRFKMLERLQEWNTDDKQDSFLYSFALARIIEQPTVDAIPKDQYEARLKADLEAILVELQLEIHELENPYPHDNDNLLPLAQHNAFYDAKSTIEDLVDEKINELKAESEDNNV